VASSCHRDSVFGKHMCAVEYCIYEKQELGLCTIGTMFVLKTFVCKYFHG
jgi:hypothetical protein